MEKLRQTTGLILLLLVIWLLSSLQGHGGWAFRVAGWSVIFSFGLWMWSKWVRYDAPLGRKLLVRGVALALVFSCGWWLLPEPPAPKIVARSFSQSLIQQERQAGKVVLVKFTADWCVKCKQLQIAVFDTPAVIHTIEKTDVVYVSADATRFDSPAAQWLTENGYGLNLPIVFVYGPGGQQGPFYGDLTVGQLQSALKAAGSVGR